MVAVIKMISFLKGIVESISYDYIEVDVSGVGYLVYVSSPDCYSLYQPVKIPTYMQVKEDDMVLYGFVNREEKELFLKLISVKGVGPKSAISMLSKASPDSIIQAIETTNTGFLKKLPGIGPKAAQQIILDLKGQLKMEAPKTSIKDNVDLQEAREALKGFGFKVSEIDSALAKLNGENLKVDEYIIRALALLRRD